MTQQAAVPPGWYRSPEDPALLRFWDGELWTDRIRTAPSAPQVPITEPDGYVGSAEIVASQLIDDETIEAGFRGRSTWGVGRRWVAATNERLIIVKRKGFRGWETQTYDYGDIRSVGVIDGCCGFVETADGKTKFTVQGTSSNESLADLLEYVRYRRKVDDVETIDVRSLPRPQHHLHSSKRSTFPAPSQTPAIDVDSLVERIRKLDSLRSDGLLTDTEFEEQKRKLLEAS